MGWVEDAMYSVAACLPPARDNASSPARRALPPVQRLDVVGPLELLSLRSGSGPVNLAASAGPGAIGLIFADQLASVSQAQGAVELNSGEWAVFKINRQVEVDGAGSTRIAMIDPAAFYEHWAALGALSLKPFGAEESINRIVFSLFGSIFAEAPRLRPGEGEELAEAALHVLKRALNLAAASQTPRVALHKRVRELVDWRIRDPSLSPDMIAKILRCSPRHVHRAFEGEAETLSQYILRRRLERCRQDLSAPQLGRRSITEVAFSWGFNNASHFSRVFKRQFGFPPSTARRNGPSLTA
jgi:AraC-like DNA-binding protein